MTEFQCLPLEFFVGWLDNTNIGKIEVKYSWVPKRSSGGNPTEGSSSAGNPGEGLPQELVLSRSDAVYYYVHDYLGSIAATLDDRGEFVFAEQVYPYGEIKQKYEAGTATQQRFDFTGKERDAETGLHYYGARYYDSKLGIRLSVDPLLDEYLGLSPYNYCTNNPLRNIATDGRGIWDKVKGFVSAVVQDCIPLMQSQNGVSPVSAYSGDVEDYMQGRKAGHITSTLIGAGEALVGLVETGGGAAISLTGGGAIVGVPAMVAGGATVAQGVVTMATAAGNAQADNIAFSSISNGKNEKNGDGGRQMKKAEKQIDGYEEQLKAATGREAKKIKTKI